MNRSSLAALLAVIVTAGCSLDHLATRKAIDMTLRGLPAYDRETDVEFGEQAATANIKFLEGLLESEPRNSALLVAVARAYSRYAWGFLQPRVECARQLGAPAAEERWVRRAGDFYGRAHAYGLQLLCSAHPDFVAAQNGDSVALARALQELGARDVPALFWTAFAWGNELACGPINAQALGDLRKTACMMERAIELQEGYGEGGAHLYLGAYYGRLPAFLGGDTALSRQHLARASALAASSYLPVHLLVAEMTWRRTADTAAYVDSLRAIAQDRQAAPSAFNLDNAVTRWLATIRTAGLDPRSPCDCGEVYGRPVP
jgi:hypothetical protein